MQAADKRPRVIQACEACRASKLKCSGELPCQGCELRGLDCAYASTSRGLPAGLVDSLREENAALKARVAALEAAARVPAPGGSAELSLRSIDTPAIDLTSSGVLGFCNATVMYHPPPLEDKVCPRSPCFRSLSIIV